MKAGADVHCRDKQGNTPLHIAITRAREDVARALIENGSDVLAINIQGRTCLHMTTCFGAFGLVAKTNSSRGASKCC